MIKLYALIWRVYAIVYDSLRSLAPYRSMLGCLASAVRPGQNLRVLDVGCGTGNASATIKKSNCLPNAEYVGLDINPAMLTRARRQYPWLTLHLGSIEDGLPFEANSFDIIVASNVLYVLSDLQAAVAEMRRVLRPDGQLLITTPRHQPKLWAIVKEQVRTAGIWTLGVRIASLLMVGLLNLIIVRNKHYTFSTDTELRTLLGIDTLATTYADQVWLAVAGKEG